MPNIYLASDHAGFKRKEEVKLAFEKLTDFSIVDLGPDSEERTDYPDWADQVASKLSQGKGRGILICGSGQGMVIRANRYPGIRAALCWNEEVAKLARQHNDANLLCLPGRLIDAETTTAIVKAFFSTKFEGGRHADRVKKLDAPLKKT